MSPEKVVTRKLAKKGRYLNKYILENYIHEKTGLVLSAEFVILMRLALSEDSEAKPKLTDFLCR